MLDNPAVLKAAEGIARRYGYGWNDPIMRERFMADAEAALEAAGYTALRDGLERLVSLQAHYAKLLNMHDDGERIAFKNADEWLARLEYLETEAGKQLKREGL